MILFLPINAIFTFKVETDILGESELRGMALNMVLWNWETAVDVEFFCDVPYDIFILIIDHPHLNTISELNVFEIIQKWIETEIETRVMYCLSLLQCLRINSLSANDILKILDSPLVKRDTESFNYVKTILHEERKQSQIENNQSTKDGLDCDKTPPTVTKASSLQPRQVPRVPCVVCRVNPRPGEKMTQKDSIPRLFKYNNNTLLPSICFNEVSIDTIGSDKEKFITLSKLLKDSLHSQGFQITGNNGCMFYVSGGGINQWSSGTNGLGKSNWIKYVWQYNTITSLWDVVCEVNIDR